MKKLWILLIAVFIFSFAILGWIGTEIFRQAPPIPNEVVTTDGRVIIANEQQFIDKGLSAIEDVSIAKTWLHSDCRWLEDDSHILIVKPL